MRKDYGYTELYRTFTINKVWKSMGDHPKFLYTNTANCVNRSQDIIMHIITTQNPKKEGRSNLNT